MILKILIKLFMIEPIVDFYRNISKIIFIGAMILNFALILRILKMPVIWKNIIRKPS